MTRQEMVDRVHDHFCVQRNPPAISNGRCAYRTTDGCRCAIGIFIPDAFYSSEMEDLTASELLNYHWFRERFDDLGAIFLDELQECHDRAATNDVSDLRAGKPAVGCMSFHVALAWRLRRLAGAYELAVPGEVT